MQEASSSVHGPFKLGGNVSIGGMSAVIDQHGKILHGDACPCADSTLKVDIECECDYVSSFHHNTTAVEDYLCAYTHATKMVDMQRGFRIERKSSLLEEAMGGVRDASESRSLSCAQLNFRMAETSLLDQEAS